MNSGPICAMVWEGRDAVKTGRVLLGATNPLASAPGTIRYVPKPPFRPAIGETLEP